MARTRVWHGLLFPLSDSPHEPMNQWFGLIVLQVHLRNLIWNLTMANRKTLENLFQTACLEFHIQFRSRVETTIHRWTYFCRIQRLWKKRIAVAEKRCWQQPRSEFGGWIFDEQLQIMQDTTMDFLWKTSDSQPTSSWVWGGHKCFQKMGDTQSMIIVMEEMMMKPWQICTYIYIYYYLQWILIYEKALGVLILGQF